MRDLIDRQSAIDAPVKMVSEGLDWIPVYHIKDLPSAQPERKKGKWIYRRSIGWGETWVCSECGEKTTSTVMGEPRYKWCPMCGADMRGEHED